MADMYYYNGVLLPEIPAEAIAEAPYCWMRHNGTEVSCFCSSNPNYLKSDGTIEPSAASIFYKYDFDAVTNLWKLITRWGAAIGGWQAIIDGWNLLWSNHDIPDGSADSTSIYFPAMKAYKAMDVFTPDAVAISRERMTGIANQVRRISSADGELTPAQIEEGLSAVKVYKDSEEVAF